MILSDADYAALVKNMSTEHAFGGSFSRRVGWEHLYFQHHKAKGIKLRGKYRPR